MKLITAAAGVAALVAVSLPAQRNSNQKEIWEFLSGKYDGNADGKVTAAEYDRGAAKFAAYDRTGDGVITAADFEARRRGMTSQRAGQTLVQCADQDGSRDVPPAEWQAFLDSLLADGVLTEEELAFVTRESRGRERALGTRTAAQIVGVLDADGDGKLDASELDPVFATADKNRDKTLAWDEMGLRPPAPKQGDVAPDFELPYLSDPDRLAKLSSFAGKKPVALIFGSFT